MSLLRLSRPALLVATVAAMLGLGLVATGSAAEAKPKKADTKAKFVPKEITFATKATPAKVKPGGTVTYTVTATLDHPWHVYAYAKTQAADAPTATQFDLFDPAGLKPSGDWKPDKAATKKKDAGFPNPVEYHEDEVTWTLKLKVPDDAAEGKKSIRNQVHFMICDPNSCKPETFYTLPDASVTVAADGEAMLPLDQQSALVATLVASDASTAARPAASAKPAASGKIEGEVGEVLDRGLLPFLGWSALGGLVALLMPCVWPMIPITVNFFVKQGEANKGGATRLAVVYCLAIIGIFTSLGLVVTYLKGASGASDLGNNAWLNLIMGVAFIAMGLMLLGLFEIRLPNFLLNLTSANEGRGGLVGVMFMAATLTITSFTCTAPVVGGLLGAAVKGHVLYPVLGMLTFSAVLSLPFFVLALVPSMMKKMPRSGDWMNAVKVVGGLVEIAAAFKFLNTAEISFGTNPSSAWIDATVILTAWVVAALVCGIYLLGLFRTDHDGDAAKVGPLRLVGGMVFLGAALYLAPALFGHPPKSRIYDQIAGILPKDIERFDEAERYNGIRTEQILAYLENLQANGTTLAGKGNGAAGTPSLLLGPQKARSADPKQAIREERRFHGVTWGMSYDDALAEAKKSGKPVLIDFTGVNCANCRVVETSVFPKKEVVEELKKFVPVQLYNDTVDIDSIPEEARRQLADENKERQFDMVGSIATPFYVIVSPEGKVLAKTGYQADHGFLVRFLKDSLSKYQPGEKLAQGHAGG